MKTTFSIAAIAGLVLLGTGCDKLKSRDQLNRGVQAFRGAKYPEAVDHFKEAVRLDEKNSNARVYLATAYMTQYIPGAESPENVQMAKAAKDEFLRVLETNPKDKIALASLASLSYHQAEGVQDLDAKFKKLDESKEWDLKLIAVDPRNKDAYYSLAVIDWLKWYPAWQGARNRMNMRAEDPGPLKDKKVRAELIEKYGAMIEDGIKNLQKALEIDPQYDEAMAYTNLLIRERADLKDTPAEYKTDVDEADRWVQKALETKKLKAAKPSAATGITPN